jgi:ribonuclease HI
MGNILHSDPSGHSKALQAPAGCKTWHMPKDRMPTMFDHRRPFRVIIPTRQEWPGGKLEGNGRQTWYTDGSKTTTGTGAGICRLKPRAEASYSLGQYPTVFQAEVLAIQRAAEEIQKRGPGAQPIQIYSDSQAALKALSSDRVTSLTVRDCKAALSNLARRNQVTLTWIPGHMGHKGNERADELARLGSANQFVGPEPVLGIPWSAVRQELETWSIQMHDHYWINQQGLRQSKLFVPEPSSGKASRANLSRLDLRKIVGLRTGHCPLRKHLKQISIQTESTLCRLCCEEDETSEHVLCECPAVARLRAQHLGEGFLKPDSIRAKSDRDILNFIKSAGIQYE